MFWTIFSFWYKYFFIALKYSKGGYSLIWIPYAFICMYSAFVNSDHITPIVSTIPALLAKSSMLWSSIFFIYTNKDLRSFIEWRRKTPFFISPRSATSTHSPAARN